MTTFWRITSGARGCHLYFHDPLQNVGKYFASVGIGAVMGGVVNGGIAAIKGNNLWNGNLGAYKIPTPKLLPTKIEAAMPKTELVSQPIKSLASEIPSANGATGVQQPLPSTGRVLTLDPEMGFTKSHLGKPGICFGRISESIQPTVIYQ